MHNTDLDAGYASVNMSVHQRCGELISRPVPATKTGQALSRQYRATPSALNILGVYLVPSSGVADPSLTSEGSALSLPSLGSAHGGESIYLWLTLEQEGNGIAFCTFHTEYETSITTERPLSCINNIRRPARTAVGSAMRFYRYIYTWVARND